MHIIDRLRILLFRLPPADEVQPYTWWTTAVHSLWVVPCMLAAHLRLRYPTLHTRWRALYAAVSVPLLVHLVFLRRVINSERPVHDTGSGFFAFIGMTVVCDYCFTADIDEFDVRGAEEYRQWQEKEKETETAGKAVVAADLQALRRPLFFPGTFFPIEVEAIFNGRGTGFVRGPAHSSKRYKAGYEAYIDALKLKKNEDQARKLKWKAITDTLSLFVAMHFLLDLVAAIVTNPTIMPIDGRPAPIYSLEEIRDGPTGTIGMLAVMVATASFIVGGMLYVECIFNMIEIAFAPAWTIPVVVSRYNPACANNPQLSTSVQDLWNERWQQRHRRLFLVAGYRPAKRLARRMGLARSPSHAFALIGAFLVSGVAHELCLESLLPHFQVWDKQMGIVDQPIRTSDRGFGARNYAMTRYFVKQSFAIILENIWTETVEPRIATVLFSKPTKQLLSGRTRSIVGWMWCMSWMLYTSYDFVDLWLRHGFAAVPSYGRAKPLPAPLLRLLLRHLVRV